MVGHIRRYVRRATGVKQTLRSPGQSVARDSEPNGGACQPVVLTPRPCQRGGMQTMIDPRTRYLADGLPEQEQLPVTCGKGL